MTTFSIRAQRKQGRLAKLDNFFNKANAPRLRATRYALVEASRAGLLAASKAAPSFTGDLSNRLRSMANDRASLEPMIRKHMASKQIFFYMYWKFENQTGESDDPAVYAALQSEGVPLSHKFEKRPPVMSLLPWVEEVLGYEKAEAYRVAKRISNAIFRRGVRPKEFLGEGFAVTAELAKKAIGMYFFGDVLGRGTAFEYTI